MTTNSISARDLLLLFLELRGLLPDLDEWSEEKVAAYPPGLVRLKQLRSLFDAFGIEWDPQSFLRGEFIDGDDQRYRVFIERETAHLRKDEWSNLQRLNRYFSI